MSRSKRLMPFATVSAPDPEINLFTDEDWSDIEKILKASVPRPARDEIEKITASFILFEPFERAAATLQPSIECIQSIASAANALGQELFKNHGDAGVYAHHLIEQEFDDPRLQAPHDKRHALGGILSSLIVACRAAEQSASQRPGHREGNAWENWIRGLTRVADREGLPTGASKGAGKSGDPNFKSPFVEFVYRLQSRAPKAARRHHTRDALPAAINRARGRGT